MVIAKYYSLSFFTFCPHVKRKYERKHIFFLLKICLVFFTLLFSLPSKQQLKGKFSISSPTFAPPHWTKQSIRERREREKLGEIERYQPLSISIIFLIINAKKKIKRNSAFLSLFFLYFMSHYNTKRIKQKCLF